MIKYLLNLLHKRHSNKTVRQFMEKEHKGATDWKVLKNKVNGQPVGIYSESARCYYSIEDAAAIAKYML